MYHDYSQEELRAYCRSCIESLEIWARRLVHEKMTEAYGDNYIDKVLDNGNFLVKAEIRNHVHSMMADSPERFKRPVDTLFIDQIIYFLCNQTWYTNLFKSALDYAYPQGFMEAREFLSRIVPIRNPLSHSNPITIRQVEQAICYSHDFIDGLKQYYKDRGEEQVWNVPQIIKVKDSLGNVFENLDETDSLGAFLYTNQLQNCGDTYSVEIEVDSSFEKSEYEIKWDFNHHNTNAFTDSERFTVRFTPDDVAQSTYILCEVNSKKAWHKYGHHDSKVTIVLTVLPPIE